MADNATDFDGLPWQLIDALPAAIYVTDSAGRITYFNEAAAALWGCRPKLHSDQWCGSWRLYGLDGTPMPHDQCPMAIALKQGRAVRGGQAMCERPDGTLVPFMAFPTPLRDASGTLIGAVNMLVELSEQQRTKLIERRLAAIVNPAMMRSSVRMSMPQSRRGTRQRSECLAIWRRKRLVGRLQS